MCRRCMILKHTTHDTLAIILPWNSSLFQLLMEQSSFYMSHCLQHGVYSTSPGRNSFWSSTGNQLSKALLAYLKYCKPSHLLWLELFKGTATSDAESMLRYRLSISYTSVWHEPFVDQYLNPITVCTHASHPMKSDLQQFQVQCWRRTSQTCALGLIFCDNADER